MRCRVAVTALVLMYGAVAADRSNDWPAVFSVPVRPDTVIDSSTVRLSSDAKVFETTEKTNSRLDWTQTISSWQLQQRCIVMTSDEWRPYHAKNQQYDFSGSLIRDSVLPKNGGFGLEWSPVANLNLRDTGGGFRANNDFGPVMYWKAYDIPLRIRGGISGSGWHNNLPSHLIDSKAEDFHGDVGFYGAFSAGDPKVRLFGRPVYVTTEAFVRSVKMVGIAAVNGSALFAHELGSGDSLFAFYGDSLSNGKERYWGGTGGQQQYVYAPWRIARSLQASGGLKFKERRQLQPAFVYAYSENSVAYPTLAGKPNDVRIRLHSLSFLAETRWKLPVIYKGGIRVWWGMEEWLFGNDLSAAAGAVYKTNSQIDSLTVKLNDHQINRAATDHYVGVTLPRGLLLNYRLGIFRDSKTFTFEYSSVHNNYDQDAITLNHHVGLQFPRFRGLDAEAFGEYTLYTLNYLKKEQSAANYSEDGYILGMNLTYKPSERFTLSERITADAEIRDYFYKQSHQNDPPPYKRRFSSLCMGVWKISDRWELNGRWDESFYDNGVWNGRDYFDSTRPDSLGTDYYAITDKTTDYSLELGVAMVRHKFRIEGGCRVQDIFARTYSSSAYQTINGDKGYIVEPFTEFLFTYNWLSLRGRIARLLNTVASDKWVFRKNWDLHIAGQAAW